MQHRITVVRQDSGIDGRTREPVERDCANWSTHPNDPMRVSARAARRARPVVADAERVSPDESTGVQGARSIVRASFATGSAVDHADTGGRSALRHAVRQGSGEIVRKPLTAGASVDRADDVGRSVLVHAARSGDEGLFDAALQSRAAVDQAVDAVRLAAPS